MTVKGYKRGRRYNYRDKRKEKPTTANNNIVGNWKIGVHVVTNTVN